MGRSKSSFSHLLLAASLFSGCSGRFMPTGIPGSMSTLLPDLENSLRRSLNTDQPKAVVAPSLQLVRGKIMPADGVPSVVPSYLRDADQTKQLDVGNILKDDLDGSSAGLARLERGRIAHVKGDFGTSEEEFRHAIELSGRFDDRAKISLSAVSDQVTSIVYNDSVIDYEPAGFERVMMHHFQALNFLARGNLDSAAVEVRRANDEQERALKAHEREVAEAQKASSEKGITWSDLSNDVANALGNSKAVGNSVKNSFQNAYTFYMSGVVHELQNEPNDAFIDYKKALEIASQNRFIQRDVARLAKQLAMTDDIGRYSKIFPKAFAALDAPKEGDVDLVVLFEDGLVPEKQAIKLPLPVPGVGGLTAFAIPTYHVSVTPPQPLVVRGGTTPLGKTERICAIDALAVKDYEEKAPAMLVRQVLRTAAKGVATAAAGHYGGGLGSLASSAYAVATEKADTRSWRSLPQNAQLLRAHVKPGTTLDLVHPKTGARGSLTVPTGSRSLVVRAIRIGSTLLVTNASF